MKFLKLKDKTLDTISYYNYDEISYIHFSKKSVRNCPLLTIQLKKGSYATYDLNNTEIIETDKIDFNQITEEIING